MLVMGHIGIALRLYRYPLAWMSSIVVSQQ